MDDSTTVRTYLIDDRGGCVSFDDPAQAQQALALDLGWRIVDREMYERTRSAQYTAANPFIAVEKEVLHHARG